MNYRDSVLAGSSDTSLPPDPDEAPTHGPGLPGPVARAARLARTWWRSGRPEHGFMLNDRQLIAWYAVFTGYGVAVIIFSGGGADRVWGLWAAGGYALTIATAMLAARFGRFALPLLTSLAFALAAPMIWLALRAPATADVSVVSRSASLLLRTGSPYLPAGQLATWRAYNPYLPAMAAFGLPRALDLPGLLGDPRPWLAVATVVLLAAAFWMAAPHRIMRCRSCGWAAAWCAAFLVASPVLAFPLAVGITDPPVIALMCFALACVARSPRLPVVAGMAIGIACAMKATAWPALAVITAMLVARDGAREAARFVGACVITAAGLVAATAPVLLAEPAALLQNTVLYPLGMTLHKTPAASPLPGHLLAATGPAGHLAAIGLLITAGLGVAASLVLRPPATVSAATMRLSIGLALMFVLAPATRFGYFAYPAALLGWSAVIRPDRLCPDRDPAAPAEPAPAPAAVDQVPPAHDRSDMLLRASRYLLPQHSPAPHRIRRWRRKADQNPMTP
ncbi:MAG TPA: glycosyltransferase 87 family protein [Streptosporangiaceae bacterium]|nr:glycosyltransferase 87 family protein [Streptosporangiaceae bacterium]